jgi:hypothetical protein
MPSSGYSNGFAAGTLASLAHTWLALSTATPRSRGARIGSRFLNNLGFVKAVFGAQIGIDRIVMSAICPPIANSYHLSLITLRVSS